MYTLGVKAFLLIIVPESMAQVLSETIAPPARRGPADERERRNRADLRAQVRHAWIASVARQSLHARLWREAGIAGRPAALAMSARMLVSLPGQDPRPLCPGESLHAVFRAAGERLLILGPPGSGKTTALFALAEALLDAADADETQPIPVVFPLASWAARRRPLQAWFVAELARSYKIPPPLGKAWVDGHVILPLLDGLDEVGPGDAERSACAEAIGAFLSDQGATAVVCTRIAENGDSVIFAQAAAADHTLVSAQAAEGGPQGRLPIAAAVELRPLAAGQVDAYLGELGPALAGLREAVAREAALRDLASSPLPLHVMGLAYANGAAAALTGGSSGDAERRVWADFVARRLALPQDGATIDPEQLRAWLVWLARGMTAHSQPIFRVEYLQSGWLATRGQRRLFGLLSSLGFTLIVVALGAVLGGFLGGVLGALVAGLLLLLLGIVGGGFVAGLLFERRAAGADDAPGATPRWTWRRFFDRSGLWDALRRTLTRMLIVVLVVAVLTGVLSLFASRVVGAVLVAVAANQHSYLGLALIVLLAVLGGSLAGAARQEDEIFVEVEPDRGGAGSRNAMIIGGLQRGLFSALLAAAVIGVRSGLTAGLLAGLLFGLLGGLFGGFISRLLFGLNDGSSTVLKYTLLRCLLHWRCGAPWDFAGMLDEAAGRGLMMRIGGGYCFAHPLLQEHFAQHQQPQRPVAPILGPKR